MSLFLTDTCATVARSLDRLDCHPSQRALLRATTDRLEAALHRHPEANPLSLAAIIAAAWGRPLDRQASEVGAFCLCYLASLDLFDDVQDDDLAGKPHQEAGPPLAINTALTLLFLALQALRRAMELEREPTLRLEYLRLFNRVSLSAAAGQHLDLLGEAGAFSPDEVLDMQRGKTSSVALIAECGALLARRDEEDRARYRRVGERLALIVQIVDDLRDIFGKEVSPDLLTSKITYPIACFLEEASPAELARFRELVSELPGSMRRIRQLLYDAGVVERCAMTLERLREELHGTIVQTGNPSAHHRLLLTVVDGLVGTVYEPDPIAVSAHLWRPRGGWHDRVRSEFDAFIACATPLGLPTPPRLAPWHLPHYLYEPSGRTIYYPDLEELSAEILPFQGALLGTGDLDAVKQIMSEQLPVVLAHEMFHFWRSAAGRLTSDSWHEEYVANRLAVGYAQEHCPAALASALELARRVSVRFPLALDDRARAVLLRCAEYVEDGGYGMDMLQTATVQLEMVTRLAAARPVFAADCEQLLSIPDELRRRRTNLARQHAPQPV